MNKLGEALAILRKLESGKTVKAEHRAYVPPKPADKKHRPPVDKAFVWKQFKKYAPPNFVLDESNEKIIYTVLLYFLKDRLFHKYGIIKNDASLEKGLLIYGDYGVGKTELFKIIRKIGRDLCKFNYYDFWFPEISAGSFIEEYMASTNQLESNFRLEKFYGGKLYIDDLGFEKKAFNRDEVLGDVLFERNRHGATSYVTTNLTPAALSERYGERIGDRLPEMFNIISWRGESFRK